MNKRIAVLQSNYIPWKGYFDLINTVDEFILYDTVQFTKNDWRNRNLVKAPAGLRWLTIPVQHRFGQRIEETRVSDPRWSKKHWQTLVQLYSKAPCFSESSAVFKNLYRSGHSPYLSEINHSFILAICRFLGIQTTITWSRDYQIVDGPTERLVDLCRQTGANEYLSGPAAKDYIREELFVNAGIKLTYIDYSGYLEYDQLNPPFVHGVSILDMIFNLGHDTPRFMKSFASRPTNTT